jgi:transcription elongation factor Elf1
MGRRKSKRRIRVRPRRTLPKVFQCPRCGAVSVSVTVDKGEGLVHVVCASCGLAEDFEYREYLHPVDYYAKFLDAYEAQAAAGA